MVIELKDNTDIQQMSRAEFLKWIFIKTLKDPTAISLVISNILILAFFFIDKWNTSTLVFSLIVQFIIILAFSIISYLFIKDFPKQGIIISSKPKKIYTKYKLFLRSILGGFIIIFILGIFSGGIVIFLDWPNFNELLKVSLIFTINQFFTLFFISRQDYKSVLANSSRNIVSSIIVPFYSLALLMMVSIPIIGPILLILFKLFIDLIFHHITNNSSFIEEVKMSYSPAPVNIK